LDKRGGSLHERRAVRQSDLAPAWECSDCAQQQSQSRRHRRGAMRKEPEPQAGSRMRSLARGARPPRASVCAPSRKPRSLPGAASSAGAPTAEARRPCLTSLHRAICRSFGGRC